MSDEALSDEAIAHLRSLTLDGLRQAWRSHFADRPPQHRSRDLFVRAILHRLEAQRAGVALKAQRKRLLAVAARIAADPSYRPVRAVALPGTTYIREWRGIQHVVFKASDGFRYRDQTYPSLTAVAFAITGARWSGPRFFKSGP